MSNLSPVVPKQDFEVLCIKDGVSHLHCLPPDLRRFRTTADSALEARAAVHDEAKAEGFSAVKVLPANFGLTELERMARIRASEQAVGVVDKSKI